MPAAATPLLPVDRRAPAVVEWLGVRMALPRSWEIVRHGVSPRKGSLVFADRTRQRLQLTWTQCVQPPDVTRLLSDHRAEQVETDPDARFEAAALPAPWRGVVHHLRDDHRLLRAACYDRATRRLLEAVLALEGSADDADTPSGSASWVETLLREIRVVGPAESVHHLQAFGVRVAWPRGWRLLRTRIQPADAAFTLAPVEPSPKSLPRTGEQPRSSAVAPPPPPPASSRVTLRRRGMADAWFDGDLARLLRQEIKPSHPLPPPSPTVTPTPAPTASLLLADDALPSTDATGDPLTLHASWNHPGPRYRRWLGRHRVSRTALRHDPADRGVYQITATHPARQPVSLDGFEIERAVFGSSTDAESEGSP